MSRGKRVECCFVGLILFEYLWGRKFGSPAMGGLEIVHNHTQKAFLNGVDGLDICLRIQTSWMYFWVVRETNSWSEFGCASQASTTTGLRHKE